MKVDIGFRRMSEDVDLTLPWESGLRHKGTNAGTTNRVRDALRAIQGEVRAEKVCAAFTREPPAIRDFYDLGLLLEVGVDMASARFVELVDCKLAEVGSVSLAAQPSRVGMEGARRTTLEAQRASELIAVVRQDVPPFDLDTVLDAYDRLWAHLR